MSEPLHILFVEDVAADAELAERRLRKDGIEFVSRRVDTAEGLTDALASFRPDAVISDYSMPGFDGIAALRMVLEHSPGTPFIMLTGSINEETAVACLKAGADDYVLKETPARLAQAVLSSLDKRRVQEKAKRADEALRASEERFRAMVEEASDGVALLAADGTLEYTSTSRVLGYAPDAITGRNALDFIHPDDRPQVQQLLADLLAEPGASRTGVFRALHGDGSWRWLDLTARNAVSEPSVKAIVLNFRDVTEQRQTVEALRQSEERYRLIANSTSDGIFTLDLDGRFNFVSPRWLALRGFAGDEVLGRHFSDLVTSDKDRAQVAAMFARGLAGHDVPLHEVDTVSRDGRVVPIELSVSNLYDPDGQLIGFVGVFRDITERRRGDEERRRLAAAVEQVAESIMITDTAGRIQYVNPAFERITGYSSEEAIGQKPSILNSRKQDENFYATMWRTITSGATWQGHFVNKHKDGTLYEEEATISPIRNAAGEIVSFVGVKRDVTQEMALEAHLRQAQKMEAIGNLAGGVAHDFNNLLQALVTQVQVLRRQRHDAEKADRAMTALEQQVKRGAALTRQLLLFSRRETAKPERFDLNEVLRETIKMLRHLVRENVKIETQLGTEPLTIEADRGEMEQVLMNLVVNASDAMPVGGRMEVRTRLEDAGHACLSVTDTGHGIPEAIRERIFEPFFTTKATGQGTGLGLSVVHGIVTKSGGSIEVVSDGERGTTFRIVLPVTARSEPENPAETIGDTLCEGAGERILLVEDEEAAREGLQQILQSLKYEVTAVRTGEDARHLPSDPPFALLLSDVTLPGISGDELVPLLAERWPHLKVILMSGYANGKPLQSAAGARAVHFLQKPFDMNTLANEIRTALGE